MIRTEANVYNANYFKVDELKVTLAENIRFDTAAAFKAIDFNQKGYITAEDIFHFLTYS